MLCTVIWDSYHDDEREEVWDALRRLMPARSTDWSQQGVYAYWDPDTHELLYVGLAKHLPERFAQHNRLVHHSGGNKADVIDGWFSKRDRLGFSILVQAAAVEIENDLYLISPMLGVETGEITRIAEGQLLALHKMERGSWPAWNRMGGSTTGAEWAQNSGRPIIGLLSASDVNLFVARRTLRDLVDDAEALILEASLHGARMQALMERHEVEPTPDMSSDDMVQVIRRFLMLRDGKLIDDLTGADDPIRSWVHRMADPAQMSAMRDGPLANLHDMKRSDQHPSDHMAYQFIEWLLSGGGDAEIAEIAERVLSTGYLELVPVVPTR